MPSTRIRLLLALCAVVAVGRRADAAVSEVVHEGKRGVLLENRYIRMVLSPADGGMCMLMEHKPSGKRFTTPGAGALLGNRVWNYADRDLYRQWERCAWEHEVRTAPGEATVVLRAGGEVGFTSHTQFERRITLRDGESKVRVEYVFHVGQELMTPRRIGLWFRNFCTVSGEPMTCYFPLDDGTVALDQATGSGQSWFYNPTRGWAAVAGSSGVGLAYGIEFRRLMCFYLLRRGNTASFEWAFRSFDVPNGGTLRTHGEVIAFSGLLAVHGAGGGVVAGFDGLHPVAGAPAVLQAKAVLYAAQPTQGQLVVTLRRVAGGTATQVHTQAVALPVGEAVAVPVRVDVPGPGTYVLRGRLVCDGRDRMDFTAPVQVGKPDAAYRVPPLEERMGRVSERFEDRIALRGAAPPDIKLSTEIESDHVKWARPYSQGKLRVLVLTSILNGREAVELAERLDMEILWTSAGLPTERSALAGMQNLGRHIPYTDDHINHYIQEQLAGRVDAIIVGGLSGKLFQPETLAAIRRKVEAGMGLVWVAPNRGTDALYDMLPVAKEKHLRRRNGRWAAAQPHFLTLGVPFAELPATDHVLYDAKVPPLANAGRYPLLVATDGPGKGRVVVLSYNTGWQGVGGYMTGITPWVRNAPQKFRYWEHHFSLLCKCLVWAAHREPAVQWRELPTKIEEPEPLFVAQVENAGPALQCEARLTVSDPWGRVLHNARTPLRVPAGTSRLAIPIETRLPTGTNIADVILSNDGKVVLWGSAALHVDTGAKIDALAVDEPIYRPGETVRASVCVSSAKGRTVVLAAALIDSLGRRIGEAKRTLDVAGGAEAAFEFPIGQPLATVGKIRVTASERGRLLAAREADFVMLPERFAQREWGEWDSQLWGNPAGAYERDYMIPLKAKIMKDYGIDTIITSSNWLFDTEYESAVRAGFKIMVMNACYSALRTSRPPKGKPSFAQARAAYAKTHDKQHLVRPVCLNSPEALEPLAEKLRRLAEYAGPLDPLGYNLGDEMSITYYVTPFDYCFGPECLARFREWLKPRYESLAALNRAWDTAFGSWDEVAPMSAHEVKGRGNYAPWAEHREFMDDTFQGFFRWVRSRLRERDPRATVGMSGSQAAEAYGGYDWSKLVHTLDFAQNYTHHDTIIMQRSFGSRVPRAPWYGYMVRNPKMRNFLWWRLLNGNRGGAYFVQRYMFFPDYRPTVSTQHAAEVMAETRAGLATLLNRLERVNPIAVHYSQPSIRAAFILGDDGVFRDNRHGWVQAMEDLQLQCEFVSGKEMAEGELTRRGYAALVLPYSVAVSDAEAKAIRDYAERGGLVLADARPGLMDERCRTRPKALLDDLFGIRRGKPDPTAARQEGEARLDRDLRDCHVKGVQIDVELGESGLTPSGGIPLGRHTHGPAVVVNRVGRGDAVLLNFLMRSYARRRELAMEDGLAGLVANLLRLRGVAPAVRVSSQGEGRAYFHTVRLRSGDATYVGSILEPSATQKRARAGAADPNVDAAKPIRVDLPGQAVVYDMRAGKCLGRRGRIDAQSKQGDAVLYALLPYRVRSVQVQARNAQQGEAVEYSVQVQPDAGAAGLHVFRVEVEGPAARRLPHYDTKLVAAKGTASGSFRTALNDPVGQWTVRATDVATGAVGVATAQLSAR